MKYRLTCLLLTLFLSVFPAFADSGCAGKVCEKVYVDSILLQGEGSVLIGTSGDEKLLNCTAATNKFLTLDLQDPNAALLYQTLSMMQIEEKKILIRIVENSTNCKIKHLLIDR